MKKMMLLAAVAALVAVACEPDPAKQVRIDTASAPQPHRDTMPYTIIGPPIVLPPWKRENCKLVPEATGGQSDFSATGPCAFTQTANVACRSLTDDMHALFVRKAKGEGTVSVYINVESYKGPGSYNDTQMFITYENGSSYYHWGSDSVHVTVTRGEKSVILPRNELIAEPPNTGVEMVSGTLRCGARLDSAKAVNPNG